MNISRLNQRIMAVMMSLALILSLAVTDVHAASSNKITLKNIVAPTTLDLGKSFSIRGKIKAKKKISSVSIGIYSGAENKYKYKYTKKGINKKSFNIKKADSKLKFGKLKAGTYYYIIKVKLKGKKTKKVLTQCFTVVDNRASTVNLGVADSAGISLSGVKAPGTYQVGKEFTPSGIVHSDSKIKKVEIGIVIAATNKWTEYKYTDNVNTNDYDLSKVGNKLRFDLLPGGSFRYRMYAHTEAGVKIAFNKEFTVKPSGKPMAAVNWAVRIANDDTFTYGKISYKDTNIANQQGCYFCSNNDKKVAKAKDLGMENPERYEKTYVCLTFIGAAYAHGAGDPEILAKCKKRRMTMYETNDNFRVFSCWMKIGACKDLTVKDLLPGDVIIKWSDKNNNKGHVCMYIGGNDLVESSGGGWSADSIAVKHDVAAKRLASLASSSKNYVMRYRY